MTENTEFPVLGFCGRRKLRLGEPKTAHMFTKNGLSSYVRVQRMKHYDWERMKHEIIQMNVDSDTLDLSKYFVRQFLWTNRWIW